MKRINYFVLILTFILSSCVHDYELKPINPHYIFHQNSSKVWLINKLWKDKNDFSPKKFDDKEIIIFHQSKTCFIHKIKEFGKNKGKKADFRVDGAKKELQIDFYKEKWKFTIASYSETKIILNPIENFNFKVELIAFPEY
jgi:hypothetical protein